jgi:hypothetical protein
MGKRLLGAFNFLKELIYSYLYNKKTVSKITVLKFLHEERK